MNILLQHTFNITDWAAYEEPVESYEVVHTERLCGKKALTRVINSLK